MYDYIYEIDVPWKTPLGNWGGCGYGGKLYLKTEKY